MIVRLFRQYSLASLLAIAVTAIVLTLFYRYVAVEHLIANRVAANDELTLVIRNDLGGVAQDFLTKSRSLPAADLARDPAVATIDAEARRMSARSAIAKIKIYNLDGMTIYSTEAAQIGEDRRAHPRVVASLAGATINELVRRERFQTHEGVLEDATLVSAYAPIRTGGKGSPIIGVFEAYTDVTGVVAAIEHTVWTIAAGSLTCLTALYLWLLLVVRRAERRIRQQTEQMRRMALHDPLTGLPNRQQFTDCLAQAVRAADARRASIVVLLLDLDGFKEINDSLGHEAGDRLLIAVSERLKRLGGDFEGLARLGGDEFAVTLIGDASAGTLAGAAGAVQTAFAEPFALDGMGFPLTCRVGIAVYPQPVAVGTDLIRCADIAMDAAKQHRGTGFQIYDGTMRHRAEERFRMADRLRGAIARDELIVHYQPRVHATRGDIVGVEALTRWTSPEFGAVSPDIFIGLAEEVGLIEAIDRWVLDTACAQLARWRAENRPALTMAVNVSPQHFASANLADTVAAVLNRHGLEPAALELEVTEGAVMPAGGAAIETILRISQTGVAIAIDDFGTRHASLAHLNRFPVNCLKIDRSFLRDTPTDAHARAIVRSIASLAKVLNLRLVAEGVETAEHLDFVRSIGCDEYQGFLYARALPPDELAARFLDSPAVPETLEVAAAKERKPGAVCV